MTIENIEFVGIGYKGQGPIPEFTDDHRISISRHYLDAFEKVAGKPLSAEVGDTKTRIEKNLRGYLG